MPVQFLGTLIVVCAMERFEDYSFVIHRQVNVFHHFSAVRNWSQQELADQLEVSRQSVLRQRVGDCAHVRRRSGPVQATIAQPSVQVRLKIRR
jgi:hypothetical protein